MMAYAIRGRVEGALAVALAQLRALQGRDTLLHALLQFEDLGAPIGSCVGSLQLALLQNLCLERFGARCAATHARRSSPPRRARR